MKKLDKYILGKYFSSFFFCILLLTVIVVVVDISEKTDDFVQSQLPVSKIITDYYFGFIPRIDAMLFPLFVFIAVIFFTSKMAGRSEIIAILSSGVSFKRFLLPYIAGGIVLSALLWAGYKYVVPNANRKWGDFEKKYIDGTPPSGSTGVYKQNMYFRIDSNTYASIKGYDTLTKTGNNFALMRFNGNRLSYNMRATNFNWDTASKKWVFNNVLERFVNDISETVRKSDRKFEKYNFKPIDLRKDDYLKDQMTTPDLEEFIRLEKIRGSEMLNTLLVERYNRDAIPASVLILTIIGAVMASKKVRGGSGAHLALGVVVSVMYILFSRFSIVFSSKGDFTPWLAAWTPNIIFGLLAFYLYKQAPK